VSESWQNARTRVRERLKRVRLLVVLYTLLEKERYLAAKKTRPILRRFGDRGAISRYFEANPVKKLQIGTGPNPLPGWLNTDLFPDIYPEHRDKIVFLDATRPLPFDDLTFEYIFSEHQIEHISEEQARGMLQECFRVLRPGGRIRIATPDLSAIVGLYDGPLNELEQHYVDWVMRRFRPEIRSGNVRCYVINQMFNAYRHEFIYDSETLSAMLTEAGFVDVVRCQPSESADPVLRGVETHGCAIGDEDVNRLETMVLEATRPPSGTDR
jgi:predicted SAM-dependent methyltransferase